MHHFTKIINILYFSKFLDDMAITAEELRTNPPHIGIEFAATTEERFYAVCKQCKVICLCGMKFVYPWPWK
jgi:hypothetical protein